MAATDREFALIQFQSLRAEILQLILMQSQLVGVNVVALGALLSVAVQGAKATIILIYPLVSLILGISWLNHAHAICRTSEFVASGIEEKYLGKFGWEQYLRKLPPSRFNRVGYWGVRSVFPIGSLLALVASQLIGVKGHVGWVAFGISATITIVTIAIFATMREESHGIALSLNSADSADDD